MPYRLIASLLLLVALTAMLLLLPCVSSLSAQEKPDSVQVADTSEWYWRLGTDPDTVKRSRAELDSILEQHEIWFESDGADGRPAKLSGADFGDNDLCNAKLIRADLSRAIFIFNRLNEADLDSADLTSALLGGG